MKRQIKLSLYFGGLLLIANYGICDPPDSTKVIQYTPPAHFFADPPNSDDNFFGGNTASLQYSSSDQCSSVIFQVGLGCYYIGNGKVMKFLPSTPADLKKSLEREYKGRLPNLTPAVVGKLNGLTMVNLTATRPSSSPAFFHFCWIQLETNIVVKVTAVSCDAETFKVLTNSLQSLKIDKKRLLKSQSVAHALNGA